jgi:hypothetical protein
LHNHAKYFDEGKAATGGKKFAATPKKIKIK